MRLRLRFKPFNVASRQEKKLEKLLARQLSIFLVRAATQHKRKSKSKTRLLPRFKPSSVERMSVQSYKSRAKRRQKFKRSKEEMTTGRKFKQCRRS